MLVAEGAVEIAGGFIVGPCRGFGDQIGRTKIARTILCRLLHAAPQTAAMRAGFDRDPIELETRGGRRHRPEADIAFQA